MAYGHSAYLAQHYLRLNFNLRLATEMPKSQISYNSWCNMTIFIIFVLNKTEKIIHYETILYNDLISSIFTL